MKQSGTAFNGLAQAQHIGEKKLNSVNAGAKAQDSKHYCGIDPTLGFNSAPPADGLVLTMFPRLL